MRQRPNARASLVLLLTGAGALSLLIELAAWGASVEERPNEGQPLEDIPLRPSSFSRSVSREAPLDIRQEGCMLLSNV